MSAFHREKVLSVRHWTDTLFSFTATRNSGFRFQNGQFAMIGLEVDGRPLLRAYSMASAGARHAVGAQQRAAIDFEADHGELPVLESKAGIAGGGEAEKRIGPVPDRKNFLSMECAHVFWFFQLPRCRTIESSGPRSRGNPSKCW